MLHWHGHSSYSNLDGVGTCDHRADVAVRLGHQALAITDHGNMNGALAHRKACNKRDLIPIVGCEAYWRPDRLVREKEWQWKRWHMILLAKNLRGWHNLIRITSESFASGFYQNNCVDWDLQERYGEGLIVTTSCVAGPLAWLFENGSDRDVREWIDRAKKIHGDDLYFSLMPHDFDRQRQVNLAVVSWARDTGTPLLHEKDSHYPEAGWVETQKIAILSGWNKTFEQAEEANRKRIEAGDEVYELWHDGMHLSSEDEDRALYAEHHPDLPQDAVDEAMSNTDALLDKIEPYLMDRSIKMPRVSQDDPRKIVETWCYEGLKRIGKRHDPVYEKQLQYEFEVVDARNAWAYFALVGDAVRWARSDAPLPATPEDPNPPKKNPIRLNTRGSAAASLLCDTSQISTLDPIAHKFKFERFMNPERPSLPDVDLDIASLSRGVMKEYVVRKYGRAAVADVLAQQHFQARAALQAVARTIYGFDHPAFKEVAVLTHEDTGVIDPVHDFDLEKLREREPRLDEWAKRYLGAWEHAVRLENAGDPSVLRLSKHAAAVVILPGEVTRYMPTIRASAEDPGPRTAWAETSKVSITEEIGVVKVDFLGLKGMDQQQRIVDLVAEHTGTVIDLDELPALRDPTEVEDEVMDIFRQGLTLGVNQFSGQGVTDFMKRARPDNVVDLTAINAIYRPGPLGEGAHNRYVKRKNGGEEYEVPEAIEPILRDTYGCLVFQEQVMELFQVLVGYSAGQADDIRKEIDKLNRSKNQEGRQRLAQRHDHFVESAAPKLGGIEVAEDWWRQILPFTGYAFNRPHAGSYSIQAYQDGWLKKHYTLFFYAVLLTMEEKKIQPILREARAFDISVLPPDINISGDGFSVDFEANAVCYGLRGIKGIGDAVAKQILADRPFASLYDFETRSSRKYSKVNKKAREILAKVGALDRFGVRDDGNVAWSTDGGDEVLWDAKLRARCEKELLGVTLEATGMLGDDSALVRENIHTEQEVEEMAEGSAVVVGGYVGDIRKTKVKRGKQSGREMGFAKINLDLDEWSLTLFPESWDRCVEMLESGEPLMVRGKTDSGGKIIVRDAMPLLEFVSEMKSGVA